MKKMILFIIAFVVVCIDNIICMNIGIELGHFNRSFNYSFGSNPSYVSGYLKSAKFNPYNLTYYFSAGSGSDPFGIYPELNIGSLINENLSWSTAVGYFSYSFDRKDYSSDNESNRDFDNDGTSDDRVIGYSTITVTQSVSMMPVVFNIKMAVINKNGTKVFLGTGLGFAQMTVEQKFSNKEDIQVNFNSDSTIDLSLTDVTSEIKINKTMLTPSSRIFINVESEPSKNIILNLSGNMQFVSAEFGTVIEPSIVEWSGSPMDWILGKWSLSGSIISMGISYKF